MFYYSGYLITCLCFKRRYKIYLCRLEHRESISMVKNSLDRKLAVQNRNSRHFSFISGAYVMKYFLFVTDDPRHGLLNKKLMLSYSFRCAVTLVTFVVLLKSDLNVQQTHLWKVRQSAHTLKVLVECLRERTELIWVEHLMVTNSKGSRVCTIKTLRFCKEQGPYSQHFNFFVTSTWAQSARALVPGKLFQPRVIKHLTWAHS
jgi:hypothetical protein